MPFDYKKEYKTFYLPPKTPGIVTIPAMHFLAVRGQGDPNKEGGTYKEAIRLLYAAAYAIKRSKLGSHKPEGYFDYVVPPLETLWQQDGIGSDLSHKEAFQWIALLRLPEFVTRDVFSWAIRDITVKKKLDGSPLSFFSWEEGLCVQCMHIGPYDNEPTTIRAMDQFAQAQGYETDLSSNRWHHELYLSHVGRCKPENLKTVIRQPIKQRKSSAHLPKAGKGGIL